MYSLYNSSRLLKVTLNVNLFIATPRNLLIGKTAAATDDVNAYIVASTCAGVSLTKSTPGGKIRNAKINVPIAVDEQITQSKSGMPMTRFHLSTKHMSKKLENIVKQIANPIITRGSISLKNR